LICGGTVNAALGYLYHLKKEEILIKNEITRMYLINHTDGINVDFAVISEPREGDVME
jgi:hypothetical protein